MVCYSEDLIQSYIKTVMSHVQMNGLLTLFVRCSDWSDWQAHPVCAVCLFCEHQSETMNKIYDHMGVKTQFTKQRKHESIVVTFTDPGNS